MDIELYKVHDDSDDRLYGIFKWDICSIDHCGLYPGWKHGDGYICIKSDLLYIDHIGTDYDSDEGSICRGVADGCGRCIEPDG